MYVLSYGPLNSSLLRSFTSFDLNLFATLHLIYSATSRKHLCIIIFLTGAILIDIIYIKSLFFDQYSLIRKFQFDITFDGHILFWLSFN
ncbi:hypothetical protein BpHYR1_022597 [Brachionus plicatilis]|uniref:Uncharacterized protein n=1 Tax=Brachionus plicatilis TaxID=10195 RepID=A0A3M7RB29_BRAPC|nr:hypothetical protein BpHYR1_022597 [Brachionus plicatilis]